MRGSRLQLTGVIVGLAAFGGLAAHGHGAAAGRPPRPLGAGHQHLSSGTHVLDLVSREQPGTGGPAHLPRIAITLPSGWFNYNGWGMNDGGTLIVSFWDVNNVYPTPCRWQGKPMVDPGRTVDGLASALATRPLRHASRPRDVALGGFRGRYLRWSVPSRISFARCGQGYFESWTALGWGSDRYQQGPGQVDRLWILDVNGQRLVVDAAYMSWATRKQRAELDRIVHSIEFVPDSSRRLASAVGATSGSSVQDVRVSDINDRGQIVGSLTREGGRLAAVARNGPWIAYSTSPACTPLGCPSTGGSDVFATRPGGVPRLVASRDKGKVWNVCPVFSPNGRMLAFVRDSGGGTETAQSALEVVRVGPRGLVGARRLVEKRPGIRPRCPRWSSDSSRLAYLEHGKVVVRSLAGSLRHWVGGDPTVHDFHPSTSRIASPRGDLVASLDTNDATVVVSRPDGSDRRVIPDDLGGTPSYAIAGWSPDGRKLLLMQDVGGFSMRAVSVDPPFTSETVVADVPVNNPRSWPGYGDVSWQPIPISRSIDSIRLLSVPMRKPASKTPKLPLRRVTVTGINNHGQIIGILWLSDGVRHGFVWQSGSWKVLGRSHSRADAINERGEILGYDGIGNAVLWEHGQHPPKMTLSSGMTLDIWWDEAGCPPRRVKR